MESTDQKFFSQMEKWYLRKVVNFPKNIRAEKIGRIEETLSILSLMLKSTKDFHFKLQQYAVLKWKLAHYLQSHESIDVDEVYDGLIQSPIFLENQDRIETAIEIFKKKRRDELNQKRKQEVFSTQVSPKIVVEKIFNEYFLVRLLNWSHLDEETRILNHCIAKSDFYINRMVRGEYEIFSLRKIVSTPVATFVYNLKNNKIEQIRKQGDSLLSGNEDFYPAVVEAIAEIKKIKSSCKQSFSVEQNEFKNITALNNFLFVESMEFSKKEEELSEKVAVSDFFDSDAVNSLRNKNYYIPESSLSFLKDISGVGEANFVELSIFDLGLDQEKRFSYLQVCNIAKKLGYEVCSVQEVCAYALQFPVQKDYSFRFFGMDLQDGGKNCFFALGNNSEEPVMFLFGKETQIFSTSNCVEYHHKFVFKLTGFARSGFDITVKNKNGQGGVKK